MSLPLWANPLLQGLSFWIGYKKQLYPHYPLSEGAIVGESQNLLYSRLEKGQKLFCEYPYSKIIDLPETDNRADLVILENDLPSVVIEVKRYEAGIKLIYSDFEKLSLIKEDNNKIRCFVLLISQQKIPTHFVRKDGIANRGIYIYNSIEFSVIRNCKASSSLKEGAAQNANYATLIEIL